MKKISLGAIIFLMVFFVGISRSFAQEKGNGQNDCAKYYSPGNLSASISLEGSDATKSFQVGVNNKIKFKITAKNASQLFIPDGSMLIRIEKQAPDKKIVAEFFLPEKIALGAGEEKILNSEWLVPTLAENGAYTAKVFFLRGNRTNIDLVSFNQREKSESKASVVSFSVSNPVENGMLSLGNGQVKINGKDYANMGLNLETEKTLKITRTLENNFSRKEMVIASYRLYKGDYLSKINIQDEKTEKLEINPGEKKDLTYEIPEGKLNKESANAYFLETKVFSHGNVFLSRTPLFDQTNYANLQPSVNIFPFLANLKEQKGDATLCVNIPNGMKNTKVQLSLWNGKEKIAREEEALLETAGTSMPITLNFQVPENYENLSLKTIVFGEKDIIDSYEMIYSKAQVESTGQVIPKKVGKPISKIIGFTIIFFLLILALIGLIRNLRKNKKNIGGMVGMILLLFLVGTFSVQAQEKAKAESCGKYYDGQLTGKLNASPENNEKILPGGKFKVSLVVRNMSNVFIPDAKVILRLEKMSVKEGEQDVQDAKIIKEEILPDKFALNVKETKKISYEMQLPAQMENGAYTIKVFTHRGQNINIEVYGLETIERAIEVNKKIDFEIKEQTVGRLALSRDGLKVNGEVYLGKGLDVEKPEGVQISQSLQSLFLEKKDLKIKQELFKGNYYASENKIDSVSQDLSAEAGKEIEVNYDAKDKIKKDFPLPYYLRTEINYQGGQIITIVPLFDKSNYIGTRPFVSYFPFLEKFPIQTGEKIQADICLNRLGNASNLKAEMILRGSDGKEIARIEKTTDETSGWRDRLEKVTLETKKDYSYLEMETKIYQGSDLIDQYVVSYGEKETPTQVATKGSNGKLILTLMAILILIIIIVILVKKRKKESEKNNGPKIGGAMSTILLVLILFGAGIGLAKNSLAATDYPFFITQTGAITSVSNPNVVTTCVGPPIVALQDLNMKYWMRATASQSFNQDGSTLTFPAGSISGADTLDFNFLGTALGAAGNVDTSYKAKQAQIMHPFLSNGIAIGANDTTLAGGFVGAIGKTNSPALTGAIGLAYNGSDLSLVGGFGLLDVFMWPHKFTDPSVDPALAGTVNCNIFSVVSCRTNLCSSLGGSFDDSKLLIKDKCQYLYTQSTFEGLTEQACCQHALGVNAPCSDFHAGDCYYGSAGGGHTVAAHQAIRKQECERAKGIFNSDNSCDTPQEQWINTYNECQQVANSCNNNYNLATDGKISEKLTALAMPNKVTVASDDESIVVCPTKSDLSGTNSVDGKCHFTGKPGTARIYVQLPVRNIVDAYLPFAGLYMPPWPVPGVCTVTSPVFGFGYMGSAYDYTWFDVTVSPPPPCTISNFTVTPNPVSTGGTANINFNSNADNCWGWRYVAATGKAGTFYNDPLTLVDPMWHVASDYGGMTGKSNTNAVSGKINNPTDFNLNCWTNAGGTCSATASVATTTTTCTCNTTQPATCTAATCGQTLSGTATTTPTGCTSTPACDVPTVTCPSCVCVPPTAPTLALSCNSLTLLGYDNGNNLIKFWLTDESGHQFPNIGTTEATGTDTDQGYSSVDLTDGGYQPFGHTITATGYAHNICNGSEQRSALATASINCAVNELTINNICSGSTVTSTTGNAINISGGLLSCGSNCIGNYPAGSWVSLEGTCPAGKTNCTFTPSSDQLDMYQEFSIGEVSSPFTIYSAKINTRLMLSANTNAVELKANYLGTDATSKATAQYSIEQMLAGVTGDYLAADTIELSERNGGGYYLKKLLFSPDSTNTVSLGIFDYCSTAAGIISLRNYVNNGGTVPTCINNMVNVVNSNLQTKAVKLFASTTLDNSDNLAEKAITSVANLTAPHNQNNIDSDIVGTSVKTKTLVNRNNLSSILTVEFPSKDNYFADVAKIKAYQSAASQGYAIYYGGLTGDDAKSAFDYQVLANLHGHGFTQIKVAPNSLRDGSIVTDHGIEAINEILDALPAVAAAHPEYVFNGYSIAIPSACDNVAGTCSITIKKSIPIGSVGAGYLMNGPKSVTYNCIQPVINGACGGGVSVKVFTTETAWGELCDVGTPDPADLLFPKLGGAPVTWVCRGQSGGLDANCAAVKLPDNGSWEETKPNT